MGSSFSIPQRADVCKTLTGTYTGNGNDDRNINVGVDLSAKSNVTVIVQGPDNGSPAVWRPEYGQGDLSLPMDGGGGDVANHIQALTSTGFQIGDAGFVNYDTYVYSYAIFWTEA